MTPAAPGQFRVIYHEPICPGCGSDNITTGEVEIRDGLTLTEEALFCLDCGDAWPLACVADWQVQP